MAVARPQLLVVDDDQGVVDPLAEFLEQQGYGVTTRMDGKEALDWLRASQVSPRAILLDLVMPRMTGTEFLEERRRDRALSSIPVVVMTARDDFERPPDVAGVLHKPLLPSDVVRLLKQLPISSDDPVVDPEEGAARFRLAQMDRLASLGTLVAGVAHEINNPLAYIISNLDFTLRELGKPLTPATLSEIRDCMVEARDGANRIRQIVRDLKTFGRVDAEKREPIDLHRIVDFACTVVDNQVRHRARLLKELQPVPKVSVDEGKLGQVLMNLLLNAAQAIPEGAADRNEISVSVRPVHGAQVMVEVRDTGSGIARENLARIFDPFFTTKPIGQGTGLGLSISHGIVASYGGEIQVESEVGKGSTFRVLLPALQEAQAGPPRVTVRVDSPAPLLERRRILVIDDEPLIGVAIRRTLRDLCEVVVVDRAQDAMTLLERDRRFDAIFCDMMMPVVSGIEFFQQLRQRDPALAAQVIFVTGGAFTPEATAFLDEVHNPVLEKPFGVDQIHAALARIVERRS